MKEINPKPLALKPEADYSQLTANPNIISQVLHKVLIEVDEKGTEATEVTGMEVIPESTHESISEPKPIILRADHPFLYFIRDKQMT